MPNGRVTVTHQRVDKERSNSYEAWMKLGSPQPPTREQYAALDKTSALTDLERAKTVTANQGLVTLSFSLPRQGVSLVRLTW